MAQASLRKRLLLQFAVVALWSLAVGVSALSAEDPDGMLIRVGMVLVTVGAAMWLPPAIALAVVPVVWAGPNYARAQLGDYVLFEKLMWMELAGLVALAAAAMLTRRQLSVLEKESLALNGHFALQSEVDEETGVYQERLLAESIERELVRSRRFGREFAVMLAGVDSRRAKFDYRADDKWQLGLKATASVLLNTRHNIDRVYRYGDRGFALLLPETGPKDITGLVRRLARTAKKANPPEGEPGGPLPLHFGVTFFPHCATTVEDLLRRAEVALRLAERSPTRLQIDGAEAPDLPAPELLRKGEGEDEEEALVGALAGKWLGAEAPEEEQPGVWLSTPAATRGPAAAPNSGPQGGADATAGAVGDLLKRLDETLGMIRSLKAGGSEAA
ncbi:MAG TPA: diguanylate cyclase [Dehalococcoidia bacterium]|nr:diguanylate cyclase [Dehalococcoidia bacterium]